MPRKLTPVSSDGKRYDATNLGHGYAVPMKQDENELWGRIEKILSARGWRQVDLCEATGISSASLSRFKSRAAKDPNAGMDSDQLAKIAAGSGVSLAWLTTGAGELAPHMDPYPTRAPVVAMAKAMGVPPGAIAALEMERLAEGDPGEDYWHRRLHEHIGKARALERVLLPDDDTFGEHEE